MSDKEIALELTKSYLEHLNIRVNNKALRILNSSFKNFKFLIHEQ